MAGCTANGDPGKALEAKLRLDEVKRDLRSGRITFREAATDPRARKCKVFRMLCCVRGVGKVRASRMMDRCGIVPARRCGALRGARLDALCREVGE